MPGLCDLPYDLLIDSLFPLLPVSTIVALAATCSYLNAAVDAPALWSRLLKRDYRFPVASTARATGFRLLCSRLAKPRVYVWGEDSNGRLGLDPEEKLRYRRGQGVPTPVQLKTTEDGRAVAGWVDIKASGFGFHALDRDGTVWIWGTLDGSRWADSHESFDHPGKLVEKPIPLPVIGLPPLQSLSAGRTSGLGFDDAGLLYEWHSWGRVRRLTHTPWLNKLVLQISCGWDYNALLDKHGQVWVWKNLDQFSSPTQESLTQDATSNAPHRRVEDADVSALPVLCPRLTKQAGSDLDDRIVKIAAGHSFLVGLTESGKVFKLDVSDPPPARRNSVTQRGQSVQMARDSLDAQFISGRRSWISLDKFWKVEQVRKLETFQQAEKNGSSKLSEDFKVTHVSATFENFAVYRVTEHAEDSIVLIGHVASDEPTVYPELQGRGVIDVCLGDYHRGALLQSGQLLTWGQYSHGALGLSSVEPSHDDPSVPLAGSAENARQNDQGGFGGSLRFFPFLRRGLALAPNRPQAIDVDVPTLIPRFSGDQPRQRQSCSSQPKVEQSSSVAEQLGKPQDSELEIEEETEGEFVYAASFAGWHSGCLAVSVRRPSQPNTRH